MAVSAGVEAQATCTPLFIGGQGGVLCSGDNGNVPVVFDLGNHVFLTDQWTSTAPVTFRGIPDLVALYGVIDTTATTDPAVYVTGPVGGATNWILNTGTLVSGTGAGLLVSGDITLGRIENTGSITSAGTAVSVFGGVTRDVANSGTIHGDAAAVAFYGPLGGSITNFSAGEITGGGFGLIVLGDMDGSLINWGTIASVTSSLGVAVQLTGDVAGDIFNGGTISSLYIGILLDSDFVGGVIENSGDISGALALLASNPDTSIGGFRNTGTIIGTLGGVQLGEVRGTIRNAGVIQGDVGSFYISRLVAGDFLNTGFIGASNGLDNAFGLIANTGIAGFFSNSGRISGDAAVAINTLGGAFYNTADGEIVGGASALRIDDFAGVYFENAGLIQASGAAVTMTNGIAGASYFINTSTGTIVSDQGVGFALQSTDPADAQISSIQNLGLIQGGTSGIYAEGQDHLDILNAGEIRSSDADLAAIMVDGPSLQVFNNVGGLIEGGLGIQTLDGADRVFNQGVIRGLSGVAMDLGDGDDLFVNYATGLFEGSVLGGDGYDGFVLRGTYTLDMLIDGFESVSIIGLGSGRGPGQTYVTLGRDLAASDQGNNSGWLDLAGYTFDTPFFTNIGTVIGNGGTINGELYNVGVLAGDGVTVTGNVVNQTLIDPFGSGVGTFTFQGDFFNLDDGEEFLLQSFPGTGGSLVSVGSFRDGVIIFDVAGTAHDQLIIGGTASINGVITLRGDWSDLARSRQTINLVTAAGGISGSPELLAATGLLFTPQLSFGANSLNLSFLASDFATALAPSTYNQTQAALGLQARWNAGASPVDDLILALNAGAPAAPVLTAYAPETSAALTRHGARQARELGASVASCAFGLSGGGCGDRVEAGTITLWTQFSTSSATLVADGNAAEVNEDFTQLVQGAERRFSDNLTAGLFIASSRGTVDVDQAARGLGRLESVSGGVYARLSSGRYSLSGLAGLSDGDVSAARNTPMGVSSGDSGSSARFARIDARATFLTGETRAGANVSYSYTYAELDDYTQRGAGVFDLDIQGDSFSDREVLATLFLDHQFPVGGSGHVIGFGGSAGLVRSLGESSASVIARFPGSPTAFEALGPETGGTGTMTSGYLSIENPDLRVGLRIGAEARDVGGETVSRGFGRLSWTF